MSEKVLVLSNNSKQLRKLVAEKKAAGDSNGQIKRELVAQGVDITVAHRLVNSVRYRPVHEEEYPFTDSRVGSYDSNQKGGGILFGLAWVLIGLIMTAIAYTSPVQSWVYVVSYGAMLIGFWQFLFGVAKSKNNA